MERAVDKRADCNYQSVWFEVESGETVSPGTTTQEKLGSALFYGIVAILAYLAFRVFEPFLASLAWAVILVVLFFPMYERLAKKWGMTTAAVASTIGVTLILIVPAIFIMIAFVRQGYEAVQSIQLQVAPGHFRWVNDLVDASSGTLSRG